MISLRIALLSILVASAVAYPAPAPVDHDDYDLAAREEQMWHSEYLPRDLYSPEDRLSLHLLARYLESLEIDKRAPPANKPAVGSKSIRPPAKKDTAKPPPPKKEEPSKPADPNKQRLSPDTKLQTTVQVLEMLHRWPEKLVEHKLTNKEIELKHQKDLELLSASMSAASATTAAATANAPPPAPTPA